MRGLARIFWICTALLALGACGGGSAGGSNLGLGPTFTGQIVATKKTSGSVYNMAKAGGFMHMAYGLTGLVTMRISNLNDLRIMRITGDIVADDVAVCGGLGFVLTYIAPPTTSRVNVLDIASDPSIPERLSEIQVNLAPGSKIACSGPLLYLGGGASGLHVIDFSNPRQPKDVTSQILSDTSNPQRFQAAAFHFLSISGGILRAVLDMGGLPPQDDTQIACQAAAPPAPANCLPADPQPPLNCFGKFGVRSLSLRGSKPPACAPGWTDLRIPDSAALDFPPPTGVNTSPVNHPVEIAEDSLYLYIASSNGRRLTIADKTGGIVFSGEVQGLPQSQITGLAVIGNILLLVDGELRIIDVTDRTAPFLSSTVYTPGQAYSVIATNGVLGSYLAYVADGDNGLAVIEIKRNAFKPLRGTYVARNVSFPSGLAITPTFENTSPLFGAVALDTGAGPQQNQDGVLAPGRVLVATPLNYGSAAADGTQEGAVLSLPANRSTTLPDPATVPTPLAGPFGTVVATSARIFTQNSLCTYSASDPVCVATTDLEGHFLEFPLLASLNQALTDLLLYVTPSLLPAGIPNIALQLPGTPLNPPLEQTGPLAPVAAPTAITAVSDGLVFVGSSGVFVEACAPSGAQPASCPASATPPFGITLNPGRAAPLDEFGRPFAFRSIANTRRFDPVAYDNAVLGGIAQDIADASPFPVFPRVQLRDNAGNLVNFTPASYSGTASSGGASTITLVAPAPAAAGALVGYQISITGGTGSGQLATISGYTAARVASVAAPWATPPDNTSQYAVSIPPAPKTPDRPPSGVLYADEDLRNPYLSATGSVPLPLTRTSDRNAGSTPPFAADTPVDPLTGLSFGHYLGNTPPFDDCATIDTDPLSANFTLLDYQDERTSLGLCWGIFGMAYGGPGNDNSQENETTTVGFDYYTRNPIYFAATGDGGIVQIDLDNGISQVARPQTLQPLVRFPAKFTGGEGTQWMAGACSTPATPGSTPECPCDPFLSDLSDRDQLPPAGFAGSLATRALQCDAYLRLGMVYQPDTRTLFVANPVGRGVKAVYLNRAASNTPQGVFYSAGSQNFTVGGFLDTPVDVAPVDPLPLSASQATQSSDLYVADRGTGAIVRMTQAGQFVSVAKPLAGGRPVGKGRISGIAISPDGSKLYLSLSEGCPLGLNYTASGCVLSLDPF